MVEYTAFKAFGERRSSAKSRIPYTRIILTDELKEYEPEMGFHCQPPLCMQDAGHILSVLAVPADDGHAGVTACAHDKP